MTTATATPVKGDTFDAYNSRSGERDIERVVLWVSPGGQFVLTRFDRNKDEPYALYHVGTGKLAGTGMNPQTFRTQKINKAFAIWMEEQNFVTEDGQFVDRTRKALAEVRAWTFDDATAKAAA